jgi:uncharacterized protein
MTNLTDDPITALKTLKVKSIDTEKLKKLKAILENKSLLCAFSGGVDSSLMLIAAKAWGKQVLAITIASEFVPMFEIKNAEEFTKRYNIDHDVLSLDILEYEEVAHNQNDRCYYCKSKVYYALLKIAKIHNLDFVIDGTNFSDIAVYRPGLKALKELNIVSPFSDAAITKQDIIALSEELNLPSQNIPQMACLATRIPYGVPITREILEMIENAESFLRSKIPGISKTPIRVRYEDMINDIKAARIEVQPQFVPIIASPEYREKILEYFEELGFKYVMLDLSGFESGKIDRLINNNGSKGNNNHNRNS